MKRAVVNIDDPWMGRLPGMFPETAFIRCSAEAEKVGISDVTALKIQSRGAAGIGYLWFSDKSAFRIETPLVGEYSVYNTMEAAACALTLGVDPMKIRESLSTFPGVDGRLCRVRTPERDVPTVFIDYAHTPEALRSVLKTLREIAGDGKLTVVFGCGGDRDPSKRPEMARAAQEFADSVVITADNPRTEEPDKIFKGILEGIDPEKPYVLIPDRRRAIRYAVCLAGKEDIVLLAGKGHEKYEILADGKHPFDEEQIAREALAEVGQIKDKS